MIKANLEVKQLSIGQLAIRGQRLTKYASCILNKGIFANVSQDDCTFELKNFYFQTIEKKKPLKILYSSDSSLSILIFQDSPSLIHQIKNLKIQINPEKLRRENIQRKEKIIVNGYVIEYGSINGKCMYQSKRKSLYCPYRMIIENQINYDCPYDKNGMIGGAISMEDQSWIGIHQGGQNQYGYGILFTDEVVQKLINLVERYYSPQIRCFPTPEDYYSNQIQSIQQSFQDLYQNIYEQYYALSYHLSQI